MVDECDICGHAAAHHIPGQPLPRVGVCGNYTTDMSTPIRAAIRAELVAQFEGSSWWIDLDGLKADADLVQVDGLIDIQQLSEAVAAGLRNIQTGT